MNLRVLVAAVAGAIVMFFLGFLIFGVALSGFMKAHIVAAAVPVVKEMPDMVPLVLSNLVFSWFYALVFDQWAGIKTFVGGVLGGMMIGIPVAIAIDLNFMSMFNIYSGFIVILVDAIAIGIMSGLSGGVIGFVLGKMGPKT
jgi:hypothetical protein